MKNLSYYIIAVLLFLTASTNAQIVKVDNHYGPPTWAPTAPTTVKYYYLPDIETYYDASAKTYISRRDGNWVRTSTLPTRYSAYDLSKGKTVYLTDYRGNTPYVLYKEHKVKYKGNWKPNGHDNGHHKGQYKGKGKK